METYRMLRERQQKEVNDFPFGFAFSDEQFAEMMKKWGLKPNDVGKIYSIGAGGYVQKKDSQAMHEMFDRHRKELEVAIMADETGEGFIKGMFKYELANHEYCYTGDLEDTVNALGLTADEINASETLRHGLHIAIREVMEECE